MILEAVIGYFTADGYDPEEILAIMDNAEITAGDVVEYCNKTIEQLDAKAGKAKERAAGRKADGIALRERVLAALTDEFQTREQIFKGFADDETLTIAKIGARLTQLEKAGMAVKEEQKTVTGKKVVYKKA